ncbi:MAG: hypothetical protein HC913_11510 [Microscillaceae bacterium]|nr:hypothetical protein [Microscillaceae bacterium]
MDLAHYQPPTRFIRLEASSKCQLKCPLCITGLGLTRQQANAIGWGHLRLDDFARLLAASPQLQRIELSNYGELFLNPALPQILKLAHQKGVRLLAANGANLNYLPESLARLLVKYQFEKIKVSIDGVSEASYQQYRQGGKLSQVLDNIALINHFKAKYRSKYPRLKWQFIVFGHNEHEIPQARQMAQELDMAFKLKFNYKPQVFPVRNPDYVKQEIGLGAATIDEYEAQQKTLYSPACMQLWTSPQVNWDGRLLGCCVNHFGDFGNVFEGPGLEAGLQSEKYQYAKAMVLGQVPPRPDVPCTHCKRYQKVRQMPFRQALLKKLGLPALSD